MLPTCTIAVISRDSLPCARLFQSVGDFLGVSFVTEGCLASGRYDGAVLLGFSRDEAIEVARRGLHCLTFLGGPFSRISEPLNVSFSRASCLSPLFRGVTLAERGIGALHVTTRMPGDVLVAQTSDFPLWTRRVEGSASVDFITAPAPVLGTSEFLYDHFKPDRWFSLLCLLHFVKMIAGWAFPPVRACFMFDDPNLHWPSYGYVRYADLASDAELHNYHVSFATVPLDAWFIHPAVARDFRVWKARLSLLIHGNDHTYHELARASTRVARIALAAQAMRRVSRIDEAVGVTVPRIMAAPHGACSEKMAEVLLKTGFDGACISRSSLLSHNSSVQWPVSMGLSPAEFFGGGLPVIPRFHIQSDLHTRARLAAFLGQPIIPVGHHGDLADGRGLLQTRASTINSLRDVTWSNMQAISETNYWVRSIGEVLHVKTFARQITLPRPPGAKQICLERAWVTPSGAEPVLIDVAAATPILQQPCRETLSVVTSGETVTIRDVCSDAVDVRMTRLHAPACTAVIRRCLCEIRDRLSPTLDTVIRRAKARP